MASRSLIGFSPSAKRGKLDPLGAKHKASTARNTDQLELKFKLSEFTKVSEKIQGTKVKYYKSPTVEFRKLSWFIEVRPKEYGLDEDMYPGSWCYDDDSEKKFLEFLLRARNPAKVIEATGDIVNFDCLVNVTTSAQKNEVLKETKLSKFPVGSYYTVDVAPGICWDIMNWWEDRELFKFDPKFDDAICVTVTSVDEDMTSDSTKARFFKLQQLLIAQMKEEVKGVEMFLKLIQAQNDEGDAGEDRPKEDFWIEAKCGRRIGFHKAVIKVRGSDHIKGCLAAGMKESRWAELKMDIFDAEIILGFKEYLYYGTVPNLKTHAAEYFKFADYCHLEQMKELAELELCRTLKENMDQAHEIARYLPTKYLKNEILKMWKRNKDPDFMAKLVQKNFDSIADLKVDDD